MQIVIIGTGNVASVLGRLLKQAGHQVIQVFGRNRERASVLALELKSDHCSSWNEINEEADLYILAISDQALYEAGQHLKLADQLVVHTAGSVSKEVLRKISGNYGVLYPLQSLRKELPVLTTIPILVDANTDQSMIKIIQVARFLSTNVSHVPDEQRLKLHLAATIVNNFTNHLYDRTEKFCLEEHIRFELLIPLVSETVQRLNFVSPSKVQTGPAIRHDQVTIDKHLELLQAHIPLQKLYKQLTESIQGL